MEADVFDFRTPALEIARSSHSSATSGRPKQGFAQEKCRWERNETCGRNEMDHKNMRQSTKGTEQCHPSFIMPWKIFPFHP